jgi:DNA-binding NarL/FixJ family response regulator/anti-sigma regulatory factor (Ser/Thr protein kinase)
MSTRATSAAGGRARANILIVDDKDDKLLTLEVALSPLDQNVVRATSGREALRALLHQDFAVILMDVNMPGLDGFETAALIRQRKSTEDTPIIFVTAFGDAPLMNRGYALGAVDYILTPIDPEVLRTKVQVFVELARKTEQIQQQARRLEQRAAQLSVLASQLAQAEQRERRRLARLLHDHLQQLLAAAKMRVSVLRQGPSPNGSHLIEQVDDLLGESIAASRSLTAQLSPPLLYDGGLAPALEWLARRMQEEHGLEVEVSFDRAAEPAADDLRAFLFQAARELLFNVVKHAGVRRARVEVALERQAQADEPGDMIRVTISDLGAGFDADILKNETQLSERFGLFGIGERIAVIDGRLDVESEPGRGTSISLIVPRGVTRGSDSALVGDVLGVEHALPASPSARSLRLVRPSGAPRIRILVADDHQILRKGMVILLQEHLDLEIVGEASDGREAVRLADELRPDVIIMDVSMPHLSGIEATRQIVAQMPDVVVIGMSMHEEEAMASAMRRAGAALYLTKGGPSDALLAAIRSAPVPRGDLPKAATAGS